MRWLAEHIAALKALAKLLLVAGVVALLVAEAAGLPVAEVVAKLCGL